MHMARHLEFMALSWVRLGRASFLTSVPEFWAEKSKSSTVVQFQHIPRQKSRRCIKKVIILLRRQMTYEFTSHFVSTRRKLLRPISERLVSTKCTFFCRFVETKRQVISELNDPTMKIVTFWPISGGRKYNNSSFVSTKCIFPFLMLSS